MRTVDGSYGEGGGQLLRLSCALAALRGEAVRIVNIRAKRSPSGLAPQHLAAVRTVAALCGAEVEGLALRAREIVFRPGPLRAGEYRFEVGTAGAITLVLQAVLPVALACDAPVRLSVSGGTDVRAAPPLDYFRHVFLPLLARLGAHVTLVLERRGYYPRGGGEAELTVAPAARFSALVFDEPGPIEQIGGIAHCANLPAHVAERMRQAALARLGALPAAQIATEVLGPEQALGPGGAIVLWARTARTVLGAATVAERGLRAEQLGEQAAGELRAEIESGASLDLHAADQLLVYLAQAEGVSRFTVRALSLHARTTMWLLEQFLPVRFAVSAEGQRVRVEVLPGCAEAQAAGAPRP